MSEKSTVILKERGPIEIMKRLYHYLYIGILICTFSAMTTVATVTGSEQLLSAQTMTGNGEAITEVSDVGDSPFREPPLNQTFSWQGHRSSSPSSLPDRNDTQTAVILIPRSDGGMYNGTLTYHSTRPVTPVVWTVVSPTNATAVIPEEFGGMSADIISLDERAQVILSALQDESTSGSVLFVGDALELVGEEGSIDEPFIITYSLSGEASGRSIVNDLESISGFNASGVPED
jgi:hypothetical protein